MRKLKDLTKKEKLEISRFSACLGNPTILSIIEELSIQGEAGKDNLIKVKGLSPFTINMNLKYLKRYDLVTGSLAPETPYRINYAKFEKCKTLLENFQQRIMSNKPKEV
jgi:DNA-binding HxlR family transcriptional regulator